MARVARMKRQASPDANDAFVAIEAGLIKVKLAGVNLAESLAETRNQLRTRRVRERESGNGAADGG